MANFTKQAIETAFLQLLNEKPLNKISVRDIVEKCGINQIGRASCRERV